MSFWNLCFLRLIRFLVISMILYHCWNWLHLFNILTVSWGWRSFISWSNSFRTLPTVYLTSYFLILCLQSLIIISLTLNLRFRIAWPFLNWLLFRNITQALKVLSCCWWLFNITSFLLELYRIFLFLGILFVLNLLDLPYILHI